MRATVIAIGLAAAASGSACKGKSAPKVFDAAVVAVVEDAGPPADAGRPWYSLPIDASPDAKQFAAGQLPFLGGEWGAVELSAVDAPAGKIMGWLASDRVLLIGPKVDGVIRGYASSESRARLAEVLHTAFPNVVPAPIYTKGKKAEVDLHFAGAKVADLYRLLSDVERKNYVLGSGTVLDVDIAAKRVPAATVASAIAASVGRTLDTVGNVTYIHDAAGTPLDEALVKLRGPTLDIDVNEATAGEAYAALAALGVSIGGGAGCGEGSPFDLRLKKVKAGVAVAVIAAVSGVAPGETTCAPAAAELSGVGKVRVIAAEGKHRVAIVGESASAGLLDSKNLPADTIGTGAVVVNSVTYVELYPNIVSPSAPAWTPASVDPPPWAADVAKARLAATLVDNEHRIALLELPDGTWQELTNTGQNYYSDFYYTLGSGHLWYSVRQANGARVDGDLTLQEK